MRYCLRSRLGARYLAKADEIRVDFRDIESIPDVYHRYKKQIIFFPALNGEEYDWKKLMNFDNLCEHNLIISCPTVNELIMAKEYGLRVMLATEAHCAWDLRAMIDLGCEYAYVGTPLFFDLPSVADLPIALRAIPTVSYNHRLPHTSGVCGQWIRPEDVEDYEDYIDVLEFEFCEVQREQTLFKVYAEDQQWSTRLDILVEDLGSPALNRLINPQLVNARLTCRQRCQADGMCHMCETAMKIASAEFVEQLHKVERKHIEK